ncbi:hypothetical protein Mterra_02512 [Calidithermus terrae]|uniref:DUF5063 domain-containing protein n=1 Tax=Calidithermus terrae TaxID=1408545 RepID=A0A399EIE4_9DEIN|nr:DUF5063 domain-containing protein [Calidithermus terrae]RIH82849.1 hypothetical protein Mterra_02512 [Calidithermus terrae]
MRDFDNPYISHPALSAFAELASEFCRFVEEETLPARGFAQRLHHLLSGLYLGALELPHTDVLFKPGAADAEVPYTEAEDRTGQELYQQTGRVAARLTEHLGEIDHYLEVFDPYETSNAETVGGSLVDDISDIYRDLLAGLRQWERGESGAALWEWRFNFEVHWGEHAISAIRAIHARAAFYDLGWFNAGPT